VRALTARIAAGLIEATPAVQWTPGRTRLSNPVTRVALMPFALVGLVLNWLPYQLPGWVARALTKTPDEPATYKILTALLAFPFFWIAEAAVAGWLAGAWAAAAMVVAAPATGYVALLFHDRLEASAG
jgi:hypothetical protein